MNGYLVDTNILSDYNRLGGPNPRCAPLDGDYSQRLAVRERSHVGRDTKGHWSA